MNNHSYEMVAEIKNEKIYGEYSVGICETIINLDSIVHLTQYIIRFAIT